MAIRWWLWGLRSPYSYGGCALSYTGPRAIQQCAARKSPTECQDVVWVSGKRTYNVSRLAIAAGKTKEASLDESLSLL